MKSLYEAWARRNVYFEAHFEETLFRTYTDYGIGASESMEGKGKILGAGYELFILAFFIGLYSNKKQRFTEDTKKFGQPIQFWGNLESKKQRKAYPHLREYIFAALIAKTEIPLIDLEKGDFKETDVVSMLVDSMEQYANYGLYVIEEKHKENPGYFFKHTSFLDLIYSCLEWSPKEEDDDIEEL